MIVRISFALHNNLYWLAYYITITSKQQMKILKKSIDLKKMALNLILVIGTITVISSCNGQNNLPNSKGISKTMELGKSVSELDKTIWNIYQDKKNNLWFSSKENGVFCYDGKGLTQFTKEDGLVSNQTRRVQEDHLGNLFFETTIGVSKYDGESFKTLTIKYDGLGANQWQLEPNDLWFRIGFDKRGPYRYDGNYLYALTFPKAPQEEVFGSLGAMNYSPYGVYSIYKDSKGVMWFGTTSLGVCRFDGESLSWHYEEQLQTTPNGGDFGTRSIIEDKNGFFWFNNTRFRYNILPDKGEKIAHKKENGIGFINADGQTEFPFFLSITKDKEGDLWMATYDNGVWRNNGKELLHYPIMDGNTEVLLFKIYRDNQDVLWLGTHNAGVYRFNGQSFEKFELKK